MVPQLFLLFIVFQFLSAEELASHRGIVNLQCSLVCVSKSSQSTNNGCSPSPNNASLPSPNSCSEVNIKSQSTVIVTLSSGLEVMCDTETDGGGWLVIQRRINGNENFYRGWEDYKKGFGDYVNGEFYLGNENIHRITTNGTYELRIDVDYNNVSYYAGYSRFSLSSESEGYKLNIGGYSGNAGDSLNIHNGMKFTTYDNDFDNYSGNCANLYHGGWWYSSCHHVNLNGLWGNKEYGKGMNWYAVTTFYDSVSKSEMKIRKVIENYKQSLK